MKESSTKTIFRILSLAMLFGMVGACSSMNARKLHFSSVVVDTHDDTTQMLLNDDFDFGERHQKYNVDIPRMKEGGMSAIFFSIWISGKTIGKDAVRQANEQIDAVLKNVNKHSSDLVLATTAKQIEDAKQQGKIAALMGVEGGHMINNDLDVLRDFANRGVRYMTLTHSYDTDFADSSTGKKRNDGLTAFGREVVQEMNKLGMIVDVSHVSDKTFFDVLAVSKAPVFASHSSCRALNNHPRNMSDDMIRALANAGGVIQINFLNAYISQEFLNATKKQAKLIEQMDVEVTKECEGKKGCWTDAYAQRIYAAQEAGKLPKVDWKLIVDHIDHAVKIAGIDHVGLGSDFDGAVMPNGMEDVSQLPKITEELVKRGYGQTDIKKILGENTLRLMRDVQKVQKILSSIDTI